MNIQLICNVLSPVIIVGLIAWLWNDMKTLKAQRERASQWMQETNSQRTAKESYKYQLQAEKNKVEKAKKERDSLFETCKQKDLNLNLANRNIEQLEHHIDQLQESELYRQKEAILKQARRWKERWKYQVVINQELNDHLKRCHDLIEVLNMDADGYYKRQFELSRMEADRLWDMHDRTLTDLVLVRMYAEDLVNAIHRCQYPKELDLLIQKLLPYINEDQGISELHEQENTVPIHQTDPPPEGEVESA